MQSTCCRSCALNIGGSRPRFENEQFTCEWKYDGERAQIHVPPGGEGAGPSLAGARLFSRNQEDNTSKYPDVLRRLPALLKDSVSSCVLDAEAVAYDVANKRILPFQVLLRLDENRALLCLVINNTK